MSTIPDGPRDQDEPLDEEDVLPATLDELEVPVADALEQAQTVRGEDDDYPRD